MERLESTIDPYKVVSSLIYKQSETKNTMINEKQILEELWFTLLGIISLFEDIGNVNFVDEYSDFLNKDNYKEVFLR